MCCFGRLLVIATLMLWCSTGEGAVYWSADPCPVGITYGEDWYPSNMYCTQCHCVTTALQTGYECHTCSVVAMELSSAACYIDKATPEENYPQCCIVKEFCPGSERYNASKAGTGGSGIVG